MSSQEEARFTTVAEIVAHDSTFMINKITELLQTKPNDINWDMKFHYTKQFKYCSDYKDPYVKIQCIKCIKPCVYVSCENIAVLEHVKTHFEQLGLNAKFTMELLPYVKVYYP